MCVAVAHLEVVDAAVAGVVEEADIDLLVLLHRRQQLGVEHDEAAVAAALLAAVGGYKAPYTNEISEARGRWQKELDRLDAIAFGEGYVPEINDANAESAFRFGSCRRRT